MENILRTISAARASQAGVVRDNHGKSIEFIIGTVVFIPLLIIVLVSFSFSIYYSMQISKQADYLYDAMNFNTTFEKFTANANEILKDISPGNVEEAHEYFLNMRSQVAGDDSKAAFKTVEGVLNDIEVYIDVSRRVYALHNGAIEILGQNDMINRMLDTIAPQQTTVSHVYVASFATDGIMENILNLLASIREDNKKFDAICSAANARTAKMCSYYAKHRERVNYFESLAVQTHDKFHLIYSKLQQEIQDINENFHLIRVSNRDSNNEVLRSLKSIPGLIALLNIVFMVVALIYFVLFLIFFVRPIRQVATYINYRLKEKDQSGDGEYPMHMTRINEIDDIINLVKFTLSENLEGRKENLKLKKEYHKVFKLSNYDVLTGALNRRALDDFIGGLKEIPARFAVMMIDIDFFKKLNDTYGHQVGDIVLREVSKTMGSNLKASDKLYRYGGEEFCICLFDINTEGLNSIATRLNKAISDLVVPELKGERNVTVSIGISEIIKEPVPGGSVNDLIAHADEALYEAKHTGRNRYAMFHDLAKKSSFADYI